MSKAASWQTEVLLAYWRDHADLIGAGVHQEVLDAVLLRVPVEFLSERSGFSPVWDVEFRFVPLGTPERFSWVLPSRGTRGRGR